MFPRENLTLLNSFQSFNWREVKILLFRWRGNTRSNQLHPHTTRAILYRRCCRHWRGRNFPNYWSRHLAPLLYRCSNRILLSIYRINFILTQILRRITGLLSRWNHKPASADTISSTRLGPSIFNNFLNLLFSNIGDLYFSRHWWSYYSRRHWSWWRYFLRRNYHFLIAFFRYFGDDTFL